MDSRTHCAVLLLALLGQNRGKLRTAPPSPFLPSRTLLKWPPTDTSTELDLQCLKPLMPLSPHTVGLGAASLLKSRFPLLQTCWGQRGRSRHLFKPLFSFYQVCVFLKFIPHVSLLQVTRGEDCSYDAQGSSLKKPPVSRLSWCHAC